MSRRAKLPTDGDTIQPAGCTTRATGISGASAAGGDVASGLKNQQQLDELIAFFRARKGKAYGFRFKDWTDYKAAGQLLGVGDDAEVQFQLVKRYPSGSVIEVRTITKPVAGTVKVYLNGVEQVAGWSLDTTTGLVTFDAAPAGASWSRLTSSSTCPRWSTAAPPASRSSRCGSPRPACRPEAMRRT